MLLSVIIPVYNEASTIRQILELVAAEPYEKEILVVDDASTDGTRETLRELDEGGRIRVLYQERQRGKGAALRRAIPETRGEVVIFQDADLEYRPRNYAALLEPILHLGADAVYGSRFLGTHRVFLFWHYAANRFLTLVTNLLFDTNLTDMETGAKAFRGETIRSLRLEANRFDIEPEVTARLFQRGCRVFEVPITYSGRDYVEGKKVGWRDGVAALWRLLRCWMTPP
ncbi:MAG: glycosyltransferase family 2 protein [Acidobacteriota bacterium]